MPIGEYLSRAEAERMIKDRANQIADERIAAMGDSIDRDIGALQEAVRTLKTLSERLTDENREQRERLDEFESEIRTMIAEIKGGSRVVLFLGSIASGGLGAAAVKFFPLLFPK